MENEIENFYLDHFIAETILEIVNGMELAEHHSNCIRSISMNSKIRFECKLFAIRTGKILIRGRSDEPCQNVIFEVGIVTNDISEGLIKKE